LFNKLQALRTDSLGEIDRITHQLKSQTQIFQKLKYDVDQLYQAFSDYHNLWDHNEDENPDLRKMQTCILQIENTLQRLDNYW